MARYTVGISIHALRKESDCGVGVDVVACLNISIHALRKESDAPMLFDHATLNISIHALRKESDKTLTPSMWLEQSFQSTLSVRRATYAALEHITRRNISIHALRKESDVKSWITPAMSCVLFQSTLSVRRATFAVHVLDVDGVISIHALRKESDSVALHHG